MLSASLGIIHCSLSPWPEISSLAALASLLVSKAVGGLLLGAPLAFSLESLAVCGRLMDLGRGESTGGQLNPALGVQTSTQEQLMRLLSACLIFSGGAYQVLLEFSFKLGSVQLSAQWLGQSAALKNLIILSDALMLGIGLAAPVLLSSLVFDLGAGLISRVLGRLNLVFELLPLKLLVGLLLSSLIVGMAFEQPQAFLADFSAFLRPGV